MMNVKHYKRAEYEPLVSVIVVGANAKDKIKNIHMCDYPRLDIIEGGYKNVNKAKGKIVVFTDTKTRLDLSAIREITKFFYDNRVGVVVGQQTNPKGNSTFWKYENLVKSLESRIGCVSGANDSLFAVRKSEMPEVPNNVLNKSFYIVTKITENGKAVLFADVAKAYESQTGGTNFKKHIEVAVGYWQALILFPGMLLGNNGSFVYISHRVMKWFVWLNMLAILLISAILGLSGSVTMFFLCVMQIFLYVTAVLLIKANKDGKKPKILSIWNYFVSLNVAYFIGALKFGMELTNKRFE